MKRPKAEPASNRRNFLKGVVAVGGVTAVSTFTASNLMADDTGESLSRENDTQTSRGYHETNHIRNYYRTLKT
jgi:hypothetical protein